MVYICVDPRNYHKARDIKWPNGTDRILAQYSYSREQRQERFRDPRGPEEFDYVTNVVRTERNDEIWIVKHKYVQSGAELMILPDNWETWGPMPFEERLPIGMTTTSYYVPDPNIRSQRSSSSRTFLTPRSTVSGMTSHSRT